MSRRIYGTLFLILGLSLLIVCTSPVTQYYVLNTVAVKPATSQSGDKQTSQIKHSTVQQIAIRQLEIPRYLDRPRMVSRDATNHLRISETHQWGGRLRDDLARTLSDNLAERLGSVSVFTAPFPGSMHADVSFLIDIRQFERVADGHVHLNVRWHIQRPGADTLSYFDAMVSPAEVKSGDYAAIAAAMSQLLVRLADKMAMVIINLPVSPQP